MNLAHGLGLILVGALLFKLAIYLISPDSPNSVIRALVTSVLAVVAAIAALTFLDGLSILGRLAVAVLAALTVIRLSYGMSMFRTVIVTAIFGAMLSVALHLDNRFVDREPVIAPDPAER